MAAPHIWSRGEPTHSMARTKCPTCGKPGDHIWVCLNCGAESPLGSVLIPCWSCSAQDAQKEE
jgi:hypothetical protein